MTDDTGIRFRPFPCCVCGESVRIGAQSPEAAATVRWSDVVRVYCHDCWPYHSDKPKRQPPAVSPPAEGDDKAAPHYWVGNHGVATGGNVPLPAEGDDV